MAQSRPEEAPEAGEDHGIGPEDEDVAPAAGVGHVDRLRDARRVAVLLVEPEVVGEMEDVNKTLAEVACTG